MEKSSFPALESGSTDDIQSNSSFVTEYHLPASTIENPIARMEDNRPKLTPTMDTLAIERYGDTYAITDRELDWLCERFEKTVGTVDQTARIRSHRRELDAAESRYSIVFDWLDDSITVSSGIYTQEPSEISTVFENEAVNYRSGSTWYILDDPDEFVREVRRAFNYQFLTDLDRLRDQLDGVEDEDLRQSIISDAKRVYF